LGKEISQVNTSREKGEERKLTREAMVSFFKGKSLGACRVGQNMFSLGTKGKRGLLNPEEWRERRTQGEENRPH